MRSLSSLLPVRNIASDHLNEHEQNTEDAGYEQLALDLRPFRQRQRSEMGTCSVSGTKTNARTTGMLHLLATCALTH